LRGFSDTKLWSWHWNGVTDVVAFGRSFLANPDFEKRIERSAALNQVDFGTLYTPGAVGYTDYATL
jgi:N-ethylmaleimide reductase